MAHIKLVGEIVAAYVANNHVARTDLAGLVASVSAAIDALAAGSSAEANISEPEIVKPTPSQIRKSVSPDAITSFVDGKGYSTLKRHLTKHGLNPDSYRAQYGLPPDYPMVAPAYSERRSALARNAGLGLRAERDASDEPMPSPKARKTNA